MLATTGGRRTASVSQRRQSLQQRRGQLRCRRNCARDAVIEPAPPTALACDFGGYVWLLAGSRLYRLDPRGPGYTDDGMARRECPGDAPTGCVGAYHGDGNSHEKWVEVGLPEAPLALQPPRASDHVIVTMAKAGPREVRCGASVRCTRTRAPSISAMRSST